MLITKESIVFNILCICNAFSAICDPGEEIIIPEPFYANYNGFAMASNVEVIPITSKIQECHLMLGHFILEKVEDKILNDKQ